MNKVSIVLLTLSIALVSCKKVITIQEGEGLADWTAATHNASTPDYAFFDDNEVVQMISQMLLLYTFPVI